MKANIITAADYVDTSTGKLTIVGAFDNIDTDKCPFVFKPFGVAIKLVAEPRDRDRSYEGYLVLRKAGTKKPILKILLMMTSKGWSKHKINSLVAALNVVGAKFDSFGTYILEVKFGSRIIASTKINVFKKPKEDKSKKTKKAKKRSKA